MSSGLPWDGKGVNQAVSGVADSMGGTGPKLSQRQLRLGKLWSYFRRREYEDRKFDWNGTLAQDYTRGQISHGQFIPPGMEDVDGSTSLLKERRPTAPLGIVRNVVSRFTGLLFSSTRHPTVHVPGDRATEEYLHALMEEGRFWPAMIRARAYGGAMGATAVGFKFVEGNICFEVFDPRWCKPTFDDDNPHVLERLEIKYQYPKEIEDEETGEYKTELFWFRRVITRSLDSVWRDIPAKDGSRNKEPAWDYIDHKTIEHGFNFVPVEWVQNIPVDDEIDGDPDCQGCYDCIEAIDALLAQAHYGTIANADPTLFIATDTELGSISKGSDNAVKLEKGSSMQYLEMNGQGPKTAIELAKTLEERAYRLAACVPDGNNLNGMQASATATEVERNYSSMMEKADILRAQYGPAITHLATKLIKAVRQLTVLKYDPISGKAYRGRINLPPKVEVDDYGQPMEIPRFLGNGELCILRWGDYFQPSLTDVETALRVASSAKMDEFADEETCVRYAAKYMGTDANTILERIRRQREADALAEQEAAEAPEATEEATEETPELSERAVMEGLATINEFREAKGLMPLPDGDLTGPQYKAKHAELITAGAAAGSKQAIDLMINDLMSQANPEPQPTSGTMNGNPAKPPPFGGNA